MRILIAPNAFKNSLPAEEAAEAIREGILSSNLKCDCTCFPIGDGGDGTGKLLTYHLNAKWIKANGHDPIGRKIDCGFGFVHQNKTAIIEMAEASGLRLLKKNEFDPLKATSQGTGELLLQALDLKSDKIVLTVGGTATVDGGAGILHALGARFLNEQGRELDTSPQSLTDIASIDLSYLDARILQCEVIILTDVKNPILGSNGSAFVFGPQKGASPREVLLLDGFLTQFVSVAERQSGKTIGNLEGGGAGGGVPAILHALLNAKIYSGIDFFLKETDFEKNLSKTDLIITGEGSIDHQTLDGKGPFGIAKIAATHKVPVIALAGSIADNPSLDSLFSALISIQMGPINLEEAVRLTRANLVRTSRSLGTLLAIKSRKR